MLSLEGTNKIINNYYLIISFRLESNATLLARSAKDVKLDSYDKL